MERWTVEKIQAVGCGRQTDEEADRASQVKDKATEEGHLGEGKLGRTKYWEKN